MAGEKKLYIRIPETLVEVSKELYSEYFAIERRLQTLEEKDVRHGLTSLEQLCTQEFTADEVIVDRSAESLEDQVVKKLMVEKVKRCIGWLPRADRDLINALYYEGLSEYQISQRLGIPQRTVNYRKQRILEKLRELLSK